MLLVAWAALSFVLALAWLRCAWVGPVAALTLYVLIPFIAANDLTGGYAHPGTIVVVSCLVIAGITRPHRVGRELANHPILYLSLASTITLLYITLKLGFDAYPPFDTMIAPIGLFLMIRMSAQWGSIARPLRNLLLVLATIEVILASVTSFVGRPFFLVDAYSRYYWFDESFVRGMGTTDHPLVLSLMLASTVPLLASLRSVILQVGYIAIVVTGLLLSESRTGLLVALAGVMFLLLRTGTRVRAKVLLTIGGAAVATSLFQGPLAAAVFSKFQDDGGSTLVRTEAVSAVLERWSQFVGTGWGPEGPDLLRSEAGLNSSLESAYLIFAVSYGAPIATALFLTALAFALSRGPALAGSKIAAIAALVVVQTFSSLATTSVSGVLMWTLVALGSIVVKEPPTPTVNPPRAGDSASRGSVGTSTPRRERFM